VLVQRAVEAGDPLAQIVLLGFLADRTSATVAVRRTQFPEASPILKNSELRFECPAASGL
jgi:hypothetical protein